MIKSRRFRWADHLARIEEGRSSFNILTRKPTRKRPIGRPTRRWEDYQKGPRRERIGLTWLRIGIIGEPL